jgi:glycosyltransferase involved in cell wall biosynthesis
MKNYLVSVITPFHNVDMEMFKECCQSMLQQTIGFENVQWIVVAHNCQPQYNRLLGDMLGHHDNVVLEFLDNDVHSPSSPRNHGLKMATAPYVAFLDADDRFTPHCLEEAVAGISETHSQIAWFRREFSMESNDLYPLVEIVLWNQTQRRIIVDRDHWDEEKLFTCLWGFVTSKIFDRQFLKDKDIWFDDSVSYGEDSISVVTALAQCMRICILPQLMAYH